MNFVVEGLGLTEGGGKRGLIKLLPALADQGRRHNVLAVVADLEEFRALRRPNLQLVLRRKPKSLVRRHLYLQRTIPRLCAETHADALLCLGNFGPSRPDLPTVVLLHNAHYVSKGTAAGTWATLRERMIARYARRYLRRLPQQVSLVVQTELMRTLAMASCGVSGQRITVIPDSDGLATVPGPGQEESSTGVRNVPTKHAGPARSTSRRPGPKPFTFLCLACYYPHKNLEILPAAMKRLRAYTSRPARCLLTLDSSQHPGARRLLLSIRGEGMQHALINIGALDGNAVMNAYRSADAFILPTLSESFGRTYLEAMRFNLPILTSDRGFAREVCRDAALYFDPENAESVAQCMARIMNDGELRDRLAASRQRIVIPSWEQVASRFLEVLERAALEREAHLPDRSPRLRFVYHHPPAAQRKSMEQS